MKNLIYLSVAFLLVIGCDKEEEESTASLAIEPVASFSASQQGQDLDSRYTWNFSSFLENTSVFVWDFGDGTTSNDPNPSHTYNKAGTFTVKLTAYGIPASGSILGPDIEVTQSITIDGPKTADFIPGSWSPYNLYVGPAPGNGEWWNYGANGSRPCLEDDIYTFGSDGSLTISHGDATWLEGWQTGDGDFCGTPMTPYVDGTFTWSLGTGDVLTLDGNGAYLVLPKATNSGQDGIATSRSYTILNISPTTMRVVIEAGSGVWWTLELVKN